MPDHKFRFSDDPDRSPWWRTWNDYPNPTRDALVALGIVLIVVVFWFVLSR